MTEKSLLWPTSGGTGDAEGAGYTSDQLKTIFRLLSAADAPTNLGGVAPGYGNELEPTNGGTSPVAINSGAALVYGIPYTNSASENVAIPTPAVSERKDRVVLRADWTAQTVRITRIAGSEGTGSPPALTQSAGTTWDIPLCQVEIMTDGSISEFYDERDWLTMVGVGTIVEAMLADSAVATAKIEDDAVTAGKIATGAVTGGKIANATIDPATKLNGTNGVIANPSAGNARGADAVDLQTVRDANTQVANGTESVIGGGKNNTASGINSTVPGGLGNVASGIGAVATGISALAQQYGKAAHAAGSFSAVGDAQIGSYLLRNTTSDATPTPLYLNGVDERLVIPDDTAWLFDILILGRRTDGSSGTAGAGYRVVGMIQRDSGTVQVVFVTKTVIGEWDSGWDVAVTGDDTNKALIITVTGGASAPVRWLAYVQTVEVTG